MSGDFQAQLPGLTNPITHAGRVVYNAQRDSVETHQRKVGAKRGIQKLYQEPVMTDEDFTIQPYEICVRNKRSKYISGNPTDTDIHVFSSANGMFVPKEEKDTPLATNGEHYARKKRKELAFSGIASNRAIYDPNNNANEEMLAVQVGGLQTIYNTGKTAIKAGDIVVWDMPLMKEGSNARDNKNTPRIAGVNSSKLLFTTRPMGKDDGLRKAVEEALMSFRGTGNLTQAQKDGQVTKVLDELADVRSRVMGKALSTAEPGKPFDILLGHYCI